MNELYFHKFGLQILNLSSQIMKISDNQGFNGPRNVIYLNQKIIYWAPRQVSIEQVLDNFSVQNWFTMQLAWYIFLFIFPFKNFKLEGVKIEAVVYYY